MPQSTKHLRRPLSPQETLSARRATSLFKERKKLLGITLSSLGEQLGISQPAVSQYLNATIPMGAETIIRLASIFKVNIIDIDPSFDNRFNLNLTNQGITHTAIIGTTSGRKPSISSHPVPNGTSNSTYAIQVDSELYSPDIEQGTVIVANTLEALLPKNTVLLRRIGESRFELMELKTCSKSTIHLTSLISSTRAKELSHQHFGTQFSMMGDTTLPTSEIITMHKVIIQLPNTQ